jgi:hypothetical protein
MKALIYALVKVEERYNVQVSDTTMLRKEQMFVPQKQKVKIKF